MSNKPYVGFQQGRKDSGRLHGKIFSSQNDRPSPRYTPSIKWMRSIYYTVIALKTVIAMPPASQVGLSLYLLTVRCHRFSS